MASRRKRVKIIKVRISSGFLMLLAFLFWLDEGADILLPAIAAAALHELGHIAAIYLVGDTVKQINITAIGAEIKQVGRICLSYQKEALVALAGPLTGFLVAWVAVGLKLWLLAAMCVGQGIFNLLPVGPLDGGRALYALIAGRFDDACAERVVCGTSSVVVGVLLGVGLILLRRYGNPTMILTVIWLLFGIFRQEK